MSTVSHRVIGAVLALQAVFACLWGAPVRAQTSPAESSNQSASRDSIEEVIVTARRREESLQDVPISITALSAADIVERSAANLADLTAATPNVQIAPSSIVGNAAAAIFIRGIGQFDNSITTDPGVGVYVDGVYFARTNGALLDLADFNEVEVLRGPQGTLFGKNTIGGAINITTNNPGDKFGGQVQVTAGNLDRFDYSAAVDIPLGPNDAMRVSLMRRSDDGYGRRPDGTTLGGHDRDIGRIKWHWTPSDSIDITWSADGTRKRENGSPMSLVYVNSQAPIAALENLLVAPFDKRYVPTNPYINYGTGPEKDDLDSTGTSFRIVWNVGGMKFDSITAFRNQKTTTLEDGDASPANMIQFNDSQSSQQFSEEDHLSGSAFGSHVDWLVGAIYFREKASDATLSLQVPNLEPFIGDFTTLNVDSVTDTSTGVFGDFTWHIVPDWSMNGGIRYTHEQKNWNYNYEHYLTQVQDFPPGELSNNWNPITPKLDLEFHPNEALLTYASIAKGFRSGGFNAYANSITGLQSFNPETVITYEVGLKSQFLANRVRFNTAVFYSDYKDMQLLILNTTASGGYVALTENAAKSRISGVEAEVTAMPVPRVELTAGVGYLDSQVQSAVPNSGVVPGDRLMEAPLWSGNASAQYTQPVATGALKFRADYSVKSDVFQDAQNTPAIRSSGYGLLNARIGYAPDAPGWSAALFVTNITNKRYTLAGYDAGAFGFGFALWGPPREFGASVAYRF
jgi:iron complex outermembrane receptor protein